MRISAKTSLLFAVGALLATPYFAGEARAQPYCVDCALDIEGDADVDGDDLNVCFGCAAPGWCGIPACAGWDLDGDLIVNVSDSVLITDCLFFPFLCPCVDLDGDSICADDDNCIPPAPGAGTTFNPGQDDTDGDMCGNVCDPDSIPDSQTNIYDLIFMLPLGTVDPVNDMTEPIGDIVNIFDMIVKLKWLNGPPAASPSGPSGTTPGTFRCPL